MVEAVKHNEKKQLRELQKKEKTAYPDELYTDRDRHNRMQNKRDEAKVSKNDMTQASSNSAASKKTKFCMYHLQGVCMYTGETCAFAHSVEEMNRSGAGAGGAERTKRGGGARRAKEAASAQPNSPMEYQAPEATRPMPKPPVASAKPKASRAPAQQSDADWRQYVSIQQPQHFMQQASPPPPPGLANFSPAAFAHVAPQGLPPAAHLQQGAKAKPATANGSGSAMYEPMYIQPLSMEREQPTAEEHFRNMLLNDPAAMYSLPSPFNPSMEMSSSSVKALMELGLMPDALKVAAGMGQMGHGIPKNRAYNGYPDGFDNPEQSYGA